MIALAEICLRYLIVCTSHVNRAIKSAPVIVYIGQIFILQISTTSRTICCQQRVGTFLFNKHIFCTNCFFLDCVAMIIGRYFTYSCLICIIILYMSDFKIWWMVKIEIEIYLGQAIWDINYFHIVIEPNVSGNLNCFPSTSNLKVIKPNCIFTNALAIIHAQLNKYIVSACGQSVVGKIYVLCVSAN